MHLSLSEKVGRKGVSIVLCEFIRSVNNLLKLLEEPTVNLCQLMNMVNGVSLLHGL